MLVTWSTCVLSSLWAVDLVDFFTFPDHPVLLAGHLLDRGSITVKRFGFSLQPPCLFSGSPDLLFQIRFLCFKADSLQNPSAAEEQKQNQRNGHNEEYQETSIPENFPEDRAPSGALLLFPVELIVHVCTSMYYIIAGFARIVDQRIITFLIAEVTPRGPCISCPRYSGCC